MGIEELLLNRATKEGLQEGLQAGLQQGEEKKSRDVVENMLLKLGLDDEQTAEIAAVPVAFVQKVRTELNKKSSM